MTLRKTMLGLLLAPLPALGCQLDLDESFDDTFGWLRSPLELEIEPDVSPERVVVGMFEASCEVANGRRDDGTDVVVSACLWLQADGRLDWSVNEETGLSPTVEVWFPPLGSVPGAPSVAFPGTITTGRGFLVAWVDEDGDGLLKLDADGLGELAAVPMRTRGGEALLLDDVIVDGTRWKASRFTLDPDDTSSPSGSALTEDELTGWTVSF